MPEEALGKVCARRFGHFGAGSRRALAAGSQLCAARRHPVRTFSDLPSVPLYAEWRDVLTRPEHLPPGASPADVLAAMCALASHAHLQHIHFLWRPFLLDANDDMVFELAMAKNCRYVFTPNLRDFAGVEAFGVKAIDPGEFLRLVS